ncbi:hypothetical protein [Clostridium ihumii]|uniref:hypothetical protein n=1 Tax=Clostridium ihumii TaxID=1470356 RepID=UPI00054DC378|nr:hypothetical protein [Clostridium ihumii]
MNRFENGFHSFKKAIKGLTKDNINEFDLKEIIINFHHSMEVLFKYILFNKHRLYIYNNIQELIEHKFNVKIGIIRKNECKKNTESITINFNNTIKRIIVLCEETIDKYTYNRIENLNKFRNSLIHDELNLIKEEVEQLIISILPTVNMILKKYLPEENQKEFVEFIDDKEIITKLNNLYIDNDKWKIITIVNLLTTYKLNDYDRIDVTGKNHINRMLSLLGCEIREDNMSTTIDGSYYSSAISYLKQEVCNYIMFDSDKMKKYVDDDKMRELIENNPVIADICKEYIYNMICYLTKLMDIEKGELITLIKDKKKLKSFFDNRSLINNIYIYEVLFHIIKIAESYIEICEKKKRRNEFLKKILLSENDYLVDVSCIYSNLISWYNDAKWYNDRNFKDMPKMDVFIKNKFLNYEIYDEVDKLICDCSLFSDLLGEFGEWSSIDHINSCSIEEIDTIIENVDDNKSYKLILSISVSVQTYIDHEYYDNGTEYTYIAVSGIITQGNKFSINNIKYLGKKINIDDFGFK